LLRYLGGEQELQGQPAEIALNYLGQFDQVLEADAPFRAARENRGPECALSELRPCVLYISAGIRGRRLSVNCEYSRNLHSRETMQRLLASLSANLRKLLAAARQHAPSASLAIDFPEAGLSQRELEELLGRVEN
jgi:non-ribosomal peptide synthase protein (TIGR01720 family)